MQRRTFSREFKLEAVRLIKDRGVAVAQSSAFCADVNQIRNVTMQHLLILSH
jgi:transposase-like protein